MMSLSALPDPDRQAGFYTGVTTKRFIAWVVDTIVTTIVTTLIVVLTVFIGLFFLPILWLTIDFFYRWITISGGSGTLGMRLAGIEFRRADGARFDAGSALMHTLGYLVSVSLVVPQILSVVMMMTGGRGQGLSDLVLGSVAINHAERH